MVNVSDENRMAACIALNEAEEEFLYCQKDRVEEYGCEEPVKLMAEMLRLFDNVRIPLNCPPRSESVEKVRKEVRDICVALSPKK